MSPAHLISRVTALLAVTALTMLGQEFRGTVNGRISDATGAGVPNATVIASNVGTKEESGHDVAGRRLHGPVPQTRQVQHRRRSGWFQASRAGKHRSSRKRPRHRGLRHGSGRGHRKCRRHRRGPLLEETTASRGAVLDNLRVTELPLSGRNPINFTNLTPGVMFNGNPQFTRPFDNGDNMNFSINGGLRQTNA